MGLEILRFPSMDEENLLVSMDPVSGEHNKLYIKHDLQDQRKRLCLQFCDASSMLEAETRYLAIKAWWTFSNCTFEEGLKHLQLWLAFWHSRYQQWGGYMELVRFYS